jgi:sodium-coupled neutral amino acid transporter 9
MPSPDSREMNNAALMLNYREIFMFNSNFAPLAGMLGIGYFMHPIVIPIIRSNKVQKNNERDLFLGYFFTYLSYVICGILGYIGFMGTKFTDYALQAYGTERPIAQNCITMYQPTDNIAFFVRIMLFFLVFFSFPILIHFLRSSILKLIYGVDATAGANVKTSMT